MREAGLEVREDPLRNLIGRRGEGPALMLGSHLDTVVDAGRYDGPLGVLVALEAAERVARPIEVVGFADEEGVRFGTAYLGSSAMTGRFDPAWLELRDEEGVRLGDLVTELGPARDDVLGYVEVHIEQGPVLERLGEPVGVVTAITGAEPRRGDVHRRSRARRDGADGRAARRAGRRRRVRSGGRGRRGHRRAAARGAERPQRHPRRADDDARPARPRRRDAAGRGRRPRRGGRDRGGATWR